MPSLILFAIFRSARYCVLHFLPLTFTQYGQQMQIYANAIAACPIDKMDMPTIERYYRDYYTAITCTGNCFQDDATVGFIKSINSGSHFPNCGVNNSDSYAIAHILPVVARFAFQPTLLDFVSQAVLLVQNDLVYAVPEAVTAALLLQSVSPVCLCSSDQQLDYYWKCDRW